MDKIILSYPYINMGAGILPTTIHEGKIYFLFGKENKYADTPGFSDIGGGQDGNETFMQCAIREGTEELTGFLGSTKELSKILKLYGTYNIDFSPPDNSSHHKPYRMHIFPMDYDPKLPFYYNNNSKFLQEKLDPKIIEKSKIFEKAEIRWICIDDLLRMRGHFRSYFQHHLKNIVSQKSDIYAFINKALHSTTNTIVKSNKTRKNGSKMGKNNDKGKDNGKGNDKMNKSRRR